MCLWGHCVGGLLCWGRCPPATPILSKPGCVCAMHHTITFQAGSAYASHMRMHRHILAHKLATLFGIHMDCICICIRIGANVCVVCTVGAGRCPTGTAVPAIEDLQVQHSIPRVPKFSRSSARPVALLDYMLRIC